VFWNNEILNTLRLKSEGVLARCSPSNAQHYPTQYRDRDGYWYGFAARARVLLVNKDLVAPSQYPKSVDDLLSSDWTGRVGIAKPLFGTTASHAACLFETCGDEQAKAFFARVVQNAQVFPGNKQVAVAVSKGLIAFGLTDTDDSIVAVEDGQPVEIVYPDQEDGMSGTLFIPNTVALIQGSRNAENGRRLIDFLLRPETEKLLAGGASAQIPLNTATTISVRVETPATIKAMKIDFNSAARRWGTAAEQLRQVFMD
jgi:iron(III) transport system substrate-binding protein